MRPCPRRGHPTHLYPGIAVALATAAPAAGQTLEDLRNQLREDLREIHFAQSLLGIVLLSDELELAGATWSFDNEADTDLKVLALPFHTSQPLWGDDQPRFYCEGALGYAVARESVADLYQGAIPGLATEVKTRWTTYGGLAGAGIEFEVVEGLSLTPIVDVGLSRIENDTLYGGPGAGVTAALADGIAFNWDALAATYGAAGRIDWRHALGDRHRLEVVGRYDIRWSETLQEDDEAQDFAARSQLVTLRSDLTGPTAMTLFDQPVDWQLSVAWRAFPEVTLFDVDNYLQVGGSLLVHTGDRLPAGTGLQFSVAGMIGDDVTGWTVGVSLLF